MLDLLSHGTKVVHIHEGMGKMSVTSEPLALIPIAYFIQPALNQLEKLDKVWLCCPV